MSTPKTIFQMIKDDLKDRFTPDLPYLRYTQGPIPVFLWDELQDYSVFANQVRIDMHKHYKYLHGRAYTQDKYLPWHEILGGSDFFSFCLYETADLNELDLDSTQEDEPRPLQGKVVGLSAEGLRQLDKYYENEYSFSRRMIHVTPQGHAKKDEPIQAYAYFNELEDVACYNKETNDWKLRKDLDFFPFNTNDAGVYQF